MTRNARRLLTSCTTHYMYIHIYIWHTAARADRNLTFAVDAHASIGFRARRRCRYCLSRAHANDQSRARVESIRECCSFHCSAVYASSCFGSFRSIRWYVKRRVVSRHIRHTRRASVCRMSKCYRRVSFAFVVIIARDIKKCFVWICVLCVELHNKMSSELIRSVSRENNWTLVQRNVWSLQHQLLSFLPIGQFFPFVVSVTHKCWLFVASGGANLSEPSCTLRFAALSSRHNCARWRDEIDFKRAHYRRLLNYTFFRALGCI